MKYNKAIVIVSFGSSNLDAIHNTIDVLKLELSNKFKDYLVTVAYTSNIIKNRLLTMNIKALSPIERLHQLLELSFKEVIILPTHIVGGLEYSKILDCINQFSTKFDSIKICTPLLNVQDISNIANIILNEFKTSTDTFTILVGHGNGTSADIIYTLLNQEISSSGINNIYISTIMGNPNIKDALTMVKEYNPKQIVLVPFLYVCGSHVARDISTKWKDYFQLNGFTTKCILKGLGEYPTFRNLYIKKINRLI